MFTPEIKDGVMHSLKTRECGARIAPWGQIIARP
jgi:hypothetical protein